MIRGCLILSMLAGPSLASPASAEDRASFIPTPMSVSPPAPKLAVLFALKIRLPEGRGLAASLLQAGVEQDDAAAAARIAAGHLGDGSGGCDAKAEISRVAGSA